MFPWPTWRRQTPCALPCSAAATCFRAGATIIHSSACILMSLANVAAANTLRTSLFSGGNLFSSGWYYNPFFGMYTYVPGLGGMFYSPFGNPFFSPFDVYMAYMPGFYYPGYYGNYGYNSGYSNAYNSLNYRSVPVPARSSGSASYTRWSNPN